MENNDKKTMENNETKIMENKDEKTMENNETKIMENKDKKTGEDNALPASNTILSPNVSNVKTVKMINLSTTTSKRDVEEFISFSGEIQYIEMQKESETTQAAYVTFKESKDAETAMLLSGATIGSNSISIVLAENYKLPSDAVLKDTKSEPIESSPTKKAEDMVSTMIAKGFILGKDALNRAQSFDEKHNITSKASATVASIDNKIGLTEKLTIGAAVVNEKVKEMDEKFHVSEKTKSAYVVAEQKASNAGSVIMNNPIVSTGASWVSNAFVKVANVVEGVSLMTKEKLEKAEENRKESFQTEQKTMVNDFAKFQLDDSAVEDTPVLSGKSANDQDKSTNQETHVNAIDQTKPVDQVKPKDQTNHVDSVDQVKPKDQTNHVDSVDQSKPTDQTNSK